MKELVGPRDTGAAAWGASVIGAGCAVLAVGYELLGMALGRSSSNGGTLAVASVVAVVILAMVVGFSRAPDRMPWWSWITICLLGIGVILAEDLIAPETGASGQIGLLYAVVFAGAHLQPAGAWLVASLAIGGDAVIVFTTRAVPDAVGELVAVGAVILMATALLVHMGGHQQRLTEQLAALASQDPLTGLATRRELEAAAAQAAAPHPRRLRDAPPRGTALLIVDLDSFKALNDTYGHLVGDAALVHVGSLLRACSPRTATVARLGGDELAVLLPDASRDDAVRVAEEMLRAVLATPMLQGADEVSLSVSIGAGHLAAGAAAGLTALYAEADAALYRAKLGGRSQVCAVVAADAGPSVAP
ncbi:GGDEF domain-containing protein [Actinotalea sp. M2MS4P-6]|uniref:GGDEF domain-containing protein n=1 Tax=Actinotalea sp. M2MS4P-6 TaxID=2983762 RepID=UPI0021E4F5F0|nr:GGDEF domain-containing protein [Actinotalea sp. M2MS4P-6]MCV2393194.1 GGDEF domain-containing protein [Actinotalea sp. M2MS4P-6]